MSKVYIHEGGSEQVYELFDDAPEVRRPRALGAVLDAIEERFGEHVIKRAGPR